MFEVGFQIILPSLGTFSYEYYSVLHLQIIENILVLLPNMVQLNLNNTGLFDILYYNHGLIT